MNIQLKKLNLIERLMLLQDESIINKMEKMLRLPAKKELTQKPMTLDEFYARVEESENAIRQGKIISQQSLEKEAENW